LLRILIVNTRHYLGGGDSVYSFNLADLLRSKGHEVSFFAMQGKENLPDVNSDLFVSYIDYDKINRTKNSISAVEVAWRSIYSVEARRKFSILLNRVKPDIVHLQNIHAHITPSVILEAKKRSIPVVWTLHDYKLICPNSHFLVDRTGEICEACHGGQFWQATRKRCKKNSILASGMASMEAYTHKWMNIYQKVDSYLCPSLFLQGKLCENGFDNVKVVHLPLFVPEHLFAQTLSDQGYILFLGKMDNIKGIYPLLEAARKTPHVVLKLAGRIQESLKNQLSALLPANVTHVGFKTGQELSELRNGARTLVLPSLCYENQPLSILEAFANGKPVIASNLGGMRELIGENERGLLVPPGNSDELAKALDWIWNHASKVRIMGEAAYNYCHKHHSAEIHYQNILNIYQDVRDKNG
jgi:glycosyltransferase involved in cell wall biosynthesis